jgi:hypothetical protein
VDANGGDAGFGTAGGGAGSLVLYISEAVRISLLASSLSANGGAGSSTGGGGGRVSIHCFENHLPLIQQSSFGLPLVASALGGSSSHGSAGAPGTTFFRVHQSAMVTVAVSAAAKLNGIQVDSGVGVVTVIPWSDAVITRLSVSGKPGTGSWTRLAPDSATLLFNDVVLTDGAEVVCLTFASFVPGSPPCLLQALRFNDSLIFSHLWGDNSASSLDVSQILSPTQLAFPRSSCWLYHSTLRMRGYLHFKELVLNNATIQVRPY